MDMIYQINRMELEVNDLLQLVEIIFGEGIVKHLEKIRFS